MKKDPYPFVFLEKLKKMCKQYRLESKVDKKLKILWKIGNYLISQKITKQKEFWLLQKEDHVITRALLLRSYWLAVAFSEKEIQILEKKYNKLSDLFKVLPLLGKKSKLSKNEKKLIKHQLLKGKILYSPKNKKKVENERSKKTFEIVPLEELKKLRNILKKEEQLSNNIKKVITNLMLIKEPSSLDLKFLKNLEDICEQHNLIKLKNTIKKLRKIWKKTKTTHVFRQIKEFIRSYVYKQLLFGLTIIDNPPQN